MADALRGVTRLFLDTAPIVYFVERHPQYTPVVDEIFNRIDVGTLPAVTSPVTLSECLVVPFRLGQAKVQQDFIDLVVTGQGITFVSVDDGIARRAAELRARYNLLLTDAFQVATALVVGCDALLTNDLALQRVREIPILIVDQLEL
ncbi:MAG TPA: PIN domain-containing protein [Gemmataceae bacterium]|nr:PIN domain-containing protein [Gemmataceae bacterium]